jgi:hypothetical protein
MNIENRGSVLAWRFNFGLACSAAVFSACGAEESPSEPSSDVASETQHLQSPGDAWESRVRNFVAQYVRWMRYVEWRARQANCPDGSACGGSMQAGAGAGGQSGGTPASGRAGSSAAAGMPAAASSSSGAAGQDAANYPQPTPGDDRASFVQCGAALSCGPTTGGCCQMTSECATASRMCSAGGPIITCDGPEDCATPGMRCWQGITGPACAMVGAFQKCHTNADCGSATLTCNANGECR